MLINRDAYSLQFERNITRMVKEAYAKYRSEYEMLAKVKNAERGRQWEMAEFTGLGGVNELPEGAGVQFDIPVEGNYHTIGYKKYGLGYQITEEMAQDTLHPDMLAKLSKSLGEQHRYRQDLDFWRMFVEGNTTNYRTSWDGLAPFAANHTTLKSGSTINNLGSASLDATSLQAAFEYYHTGIVSEEGIPLDIEPDMLIVGKDNYFSAMQLLNQTVGVTLPSTHTAENANDNFMNPENGYVSRYKLMASRIVAQLIAAGGLSEMWWLVDSKAVEAFFLWKSKFKLESGDDFRTGNALFKGTMRYGVGFGDYKAMYGSYV
jgi:hypothetical protein